MYGTRIVSVLFRERNYSKNAKKKSACHLKWQHKYQQISGNYVLVQLTTKL